MAWEICEDCKLMERQATESKYLQKYCLEREKFCVGPEPEELDCSGEVGFFSGVIETLKEVIV